MGCLDAPDGARWEWYVKTGDEDTMGGEAADDGTSPFARGRGRTVGIQGIRPEGASERTGGIPEEEGDTEPPDHVDDPAGVVDDTADAPDARGDQNGVGSSTHHHHSRDVVAEQPLAEHIRVLGADRDDQGAASEEASEDWGKDWGEHPVNGTDATG